MTISSMLTVLMYAVTPFIGFIVAGAVILGVLHLLAYVRGYQLTQYRCLAATGLAAVVGISALFWVPWLTNSQFAYISTPFDWIAAIGSVIGAFVLAFLAFHPLSYLIKDKLDDR
ncbi:DUF5368 family protein [Vreelandella aquamarina]